MTNARTADMVLRKRADDKTSALVILTGFAFGIGPTYLITTNKQSLYF
jgi:hypothetical protein